MEVTPTGTEPHGYGAYTRGCRCDICKDAKRQYQAALRARLRHPVAEIPDGIKHGIAAYQQYGCRCHICRDAKSRAGSRESRRGRGTPLTIAA